MSIADDAKAIVAHGDRITYPSGAAARHVRSVMQRLIDENARLKTILNTPTLEPFMQAAVAEVRHQVYRWGDENDAKKTAWDWFWTLGYLGGKAAHAALAGDWDKAKHHTITGAAMLANWHRHIIAAEAEPLTMRRREGLCR